MEIITITTTVELTLISYDLPNIFVFFLYSNTDKYIVYSVGVQENTE